MRANVLLSLVSLLALGGVAAAQAPAPTPAAPVPAAPAPAAPAPTSAAPTPAAPTPTSAPAPDAAAAQPTAPAPTSAPAPAPAGAPDAAALRKTCVDAMNADKTFADSIVKVADENAAKVRLAKDLEQHELAAAAIAKNERHVLIAYASMWILAAGFLIFMWRRQQGLRLEILRLQRELAEATKDGKDGK